MIQDSLLVCTCVVPTIGNAFQTSTERIDIHPNTANNPLGGPGLNLEGLIARFRVTTSFVSGTDAGAQFHVIASPDPSFAAGTVTLATIAGPLQVFNSTTFYMAFKAAQLVKVGSNPITVPGTILDVPLGLVNSLYQDTSLTPNVDLRKCRWLGCAITVPNYQAGPGFTAGAVEMSVLKDVSQGHLSDRLYASGMKVK